MYHIGHLDRPVFLKTTYTIVKNITFMLFFFNNLTYFIVDMRILSYIPPATEGSWFSKQPVNQKSHHTHHHGGHSHPHHQHHHQMHSVVSAIWSTILVWHW